MNQQIYKCIYPVKYKMDNEDVQFKKSKVCFFGNFPPRECGIATFTRDIVTSMNKKFNPKLTSEVAAINDEEGIYNYGKRVVFQVNKEDIEDFINTAKKINESEEIKLVCIQHEFGIFGGEYGGYLVPFLEAINKPVVIVFHSVLPNPEKLRKKIVGFIASRVSAIIVMANTAVDILHEHYGIDKKKIHVVYHGIPNVRYSLQENFKKKLGLEKNIVLSTFGLLSRGKGIEYMIEAMPELVKKYPNLLYILIGETHPVVRQQEGESYRNELMKRVKELNLAKNVKFYNKYLDLKEILYYLLASDIYVCTNLDKNQIVSGTLSYAMGCGRCVVSTPNVYAEEVLSHGRGILVDLKNPVSYAENIDKVLSDFNWKSEIEKSAYSFSRQMTWANVATRYLEIFNSVIKLREDVTEKYPIIKLNHLQRLTTDFGVLQFSKHSTPDYESGYTLDDNARALITVTSHYNLFKDSFSLDLSEVYLNFIERMQMEDGKFNDFLNNKEVKTSEDAFGRVLWALGYIINKSEIPEMKERAKKIFNKSFKVIDVLKSPRAIAFSIIGLSYYYEKSRSNFHLNKIIHLSNILSDLYEHNSSKEWQWIENYLTYANPKIPEALFFAYKSTSNKKYLEIAKKTLNFLTEILFMNGYLSLIGQNGWFNKNGERAYFDQQPIDASYLIQTYLAAYEITGEKEYRDRAVLSFNWFLGKNYLKQTMYDENTGGCYDGLSENSINMNQGTESTLSYLMARLFLEEEKRNSSEESPEE